MSEFIAENIAKEYNSRQIVRHVSLKLSQGEVVGLLGPNGAGKTTCFYLLCGLVLADSGKITLDGQEITNAPMYKRARLGIGYLPQESSIFRGMSVEDNILAILDLRYSSKTKQKQKLDQLLSEFSIDHLRHAMAISLSGGEARRLEIARLLATEPKFILLDEPLAGVDPVAVNEVRNIIIKLKQKGIGVLITDHNVRETLTIVDRGYIMHEGQVLAHGLPAEIIANETVRKVYLGENFS